MPLDSNPQLNEPALPVPDHPPETQEALDAIPIIECGEPLVDLRRACPGVRIEISPRKPRHRTLWGRASLAERLNWSQTWLNTHHPGITLAIGDAYRAFDEQARLFRFAQRIVRLRHPFWPAERRRELACRYVAPTETTAPPPHCTGGAIDATLILPDGKRADMGKIRAGTTRIGCSRLPPHVRENRRILFFALHEAGFSNYDEEWWHWSYGDSGWAFRTGQPAALYGLAPPPEGY